jgi:hypothetical protein
MKLFKIYLKKMWWSPLSFAILVVFFTEGYVYPELRFEFDFLTKPWAYFNLFWSYLFWALVWFFLFWKPNYLNQKNKADEKTAPK